MNWITRYSFPNEKDNSDYLELHASGNTFEVHRKVLKVPFIREFVLYALWVLLLSFTLFIK